MAEQIIGVMADIRSEAIPGHLGTDLIEHINDTRTDVVAHSMTLPIGEMAMLVYCRVSGDTFPQAAEYALGSDTPVLFMSTKFEPDVPDGLTFIDAPNASYEALDYVENAVELAKGYAGHGFDFRITEHHQEAKGDDVSGTARKIAEMVGEEHRLLERTIDKEAATMQYRFQVEGTDREFTITINSVRDFGQSQRRYRELLPDSAREGYAIHRIEVINQTTGYETLLLPDLEIAGRSTYGKGVLKVHDTLKLPGVRDEVRGRKISIVKFRKDYTNK